MILLAIDQSVRGFAWAAAPIAWDGDWRQVTSGRLDGGKLSRDATETQYGARQDSLIHFAQRAIIDTRAEWVGFESYAFSARPNTEVVELVGALKAWLRAIDVRYTTIQQSSWRNRLCGKVKRGTEKRAVKAALLVAGAPTGLSPDEYDALGVLNSMLYLAGGHTFV